MSRLGLVPRIIRQGYALLCNRLGSRLGLTTLPAHLMPTFAETFCCRLVHTSEAVELVHFMAAPRDYRGAIGGGGMIHWDWKNNKYIFVSKDQLNKELEKIDVNKPTSYQPQARVRKSSSSSSKQRAGSHRPSFKIQGKKACRPLRLQNSTGTKPLSKPHSSGVKNKLRVYSPKKQHAAVRKPSGLVRQKKTNKPDRIIVHNKENMPLAHHGRGDGERIPPSHGNHVGAPPRELSSDHSTFMSIITSRIIHVKAAETFWRQSPNDLLSYLVKTEDDAVTVDVLPVVIHHIKNGNSLSQPVTMGACLDLIPTLRRLLDSKIEDYVKTSLDMLRTILRYWWTDLEKMSKDQSEKSLMQSRSVPGIYTSITAMLSRVQSLTKRNGDVGSKAKIVEDLLLKL